MKQINDLKKQRLGAGLALLALSTVIVGTIVAYPAHPASVAKSDPVTASQTTPTDSSASQSAGTYKDGSYTAVGSYSSPGGKESITVHVTLAGNVVTATDAESGAHDPTATSYQASFIGGYKQYVVGKKIDAVKLKNVSGSSLTSQGFNNALKQIEQQAKA